MSSFLFFVLLLIGTLYWEYKLSRAAKLLKKIHKEEPETYELLCKSRILSPSLILQRIIGNNQYGQIRSDKLRKELLYLDEKQAKYNVVKMYVFVIYILGILLVSALLKS